MNQSEHKANMVLKHGEMYMGIHVVMIGFGFTSVG